jgi:hypothetical protein
MSEFASEVPHQIEADSKRETSTPREALRQFDAHIERGEETEQDPLLVEEIALAKAEITKKIFIENMPADQWQAVSREVLSKYSRLHNYEPFFQNIIAEALIANRIVENAWEAAGATSSSRSERAVDANLEKIEGDSAQRLFEQTFGIEPDGPIEAVKGKFSITFIQTRTI